MRAGRLGRRWGILGLVGEVLLVVWILGLLVWLKLVLLRRRKRLVLGRRRLRWRLVVSPVQRDIRRNRRKGGSHERRSVETSGGAWEARLATVVVSGPAEIALIWVVLAGILDVAS